MSHRAVVAVPANNTTMEGELNALVPEVAPYAVARVPLPRQGLKLPWHSSLFGPGGVLAATARVELVLLDLSAGPARRRLLRRWPADLECALETLIKRPPG